MLPGDHWQFVLADAIGAAKCVIVAWSQTSISSKWVRIEAEEGRRREILVPVLLDDVVPPFPFGGFQAARLVGWSGLVGDSEFEKVVRAVGAVAPRATLLGADGRAAVVEDGRRQREETETTALDAKRPQREDTENPAQGRPERGEFGVSAVAIDNLRTWRGHSGAITCIVTPDANRAVTASDDRTLEGLELGDRQRIANFGNSLCVVRGGGDAGRQTRGFCF